MTRSMRLFCAAAALAFVPALASAQAKPMEMKHEEMTGMGGWKELDAFHKVLADAWHPIAKGDYKPARAKAAELVKAAVAWRQSKGPKSCDNEATRAGLATMIEQARWYEDAVTRGASDDAVKVTLKTTHDTFEGFAEACMMHGMKMDAPKKP